MPGVPTSELVVIVDDDAAIRDSLRLLFQAEGYATLSFASADEILAAARGLPPALLLLDVRMPGRSGMQLLPEILATAPQLAVAIITGHGDVPMAVRAIQLGAFDLIEKPFNEEYLLKAVRDGLEIARRRHEEQQARAAAAAAISRLSAREREILDQIVGGATSKTIAYELGISVRTVEVHRRSILLKTQVRSVPELVRLALQARGTPGAGTG